MLSIYAVMIGRCNCPADRQLADEIFEQGIRNVLTLVHAEGEASGYRSTIRDTRANRLTPTPPAARQPDDETGTDPVMRGGGLALSIQGPSASAPAQRHHESTTIIWLAAWLGRSPSSRTAPG